MIQSRFTDDERRALEGLVVGNWVLALAVAWIAGIATDQLVAAFPDRPAREVGFWAFFPALIFVATVAYLVGRLGPSSWISSCWSRPERQVLRAAERKLTRQETWALYTFGVMGLPLGVTIFGHRLAEGWGVAIMIVMMTLLGWLLGEIRWGWRQPPAR